MKYECEDCNLIIILRVSEKYNPKDNLIMMLETNDKSFKLRNKKYADIAPQIKTVIPLYPAHIQ